jgi:hypothetical protein
MENKVSISVIDTNLLAIPAVSTKEATLIVENANNTSFVNQGFIFMFMMNKFLCCHQKNQKILLILCKSKFVAIRIVIVRPVQGYTGKRQCEYHFVELFSNNKKVELCYSLVVILDGIELCFD